MGSRMAANLVKAGYDLIVWNRSVEATAALGGYGAQVAKSPRAAAEGADVVISIVRDDEASRRVWLAQNDGALAGMASSAIGIESSTLSVSWTRELAGDFAEQGIAFLDAPVVGSRPQAESATLIYLVGGDTSVLSRARPVLSKLGQAIYHTGAVGTGSAMKLVVNGMLAIQVAGLAELLAAACDLGLDYAAAVEILAAMPVSSPSAKGAAAAMAAGQFAPAFPVALIAKDLGYLSHAVSAMPLTSSAHEVFARAMTQGLGASNMTAVAQLYATRR
jgi:3-hydroxyisobutyrate dehydrogenase